VRVTPVFRLTIGLIGLAAAAVSLWAVPGAGGFLGAGLALLMLAIALIDYRHLIIPNELTAAALALGLINAAIVGMPSMLESVAYAILRGTVVMLFFLSLRWGYAWLRKQEGLGLGDVKLAFVAGVWLGWLMIPVAIEIAALGALVVYGGARTLGRHDMSGRLPFGLFLAPAVWITWLTAALLAVF
jgi:leader peptidase (prepilin peptidase)/N-methyltransferase